MRRSSLGRLWNCSEMDNNGTGVRSGREVDEHLGATAWVQARGEV